MPVDVLTEITIQRPLDEVAGYAADPTNAPAWYANIQSVEWQTDPRLQIGARIAFVAHFLGRRLDYTYEIVDYTQGARLVMRTSEGPFPMETTYTWEPAGDAGTRMTLRNRGMPSGFVASNTNSAAGYTMSRIVSASSRMVTSTPVPTFTWDSSL